MKGQDRLHLSGDVALVWRDKRVLAVNRESLRWVGIPLTLAPLLQRFDGRTREQIERQWDDQTVPYVDFERWAREGGLLHAPGEERDLKQQRLTRQIVILKVVQGCNLACSYCYDEAGAQIARMESSVLRAAIGRSFESRLTDRIHFHFLGGEPTLHWQAIEEGVALARELADSHDVHASFALGTNGTLIDDHRLEWLINNDVAIRLSLDGEETVHDAYRVDNAGRGSHSKVASFMRRLVNSGYRNWTVLCTVTKAGVAQLPTFVQSLEVLGVPSVQFQPCRSQGFAKGISDLIPSGLEYSRSLQQTTDLVIRGEVSNIRIEALLRSAFPFLSGRSVYAGCTGERCGAGSEIIAYDHDGSIGACDTIPKGPLRHMGHLHESVINFFPTVRKASVASTSECSSCAWLKPCRGGCPGAAASDDGNFFAKHARDCESNRDFFPYLLEAMGSSQTLCDYLVRHMDAPDQDILLDSVS